MLLTQVLQNLNITILPIIIIPVSGLCCLVFYNRITALIGNLHSAQRELRELFLKKPEYIPDRKQELALALTRECELLHKKANLIRAAIVFCFSGIISFVLSAVSIMLELLWQEMVFVTFFLWLMGALCFATGLLLGIIEIQNPNLRSLKYESELITQWSKQD